MEVQVVLRSTDSSKRMGRSCGKGKSDLDKIETLLTFASGTYEPQINPFSWTNLTNMVWVDQPIGTGFSPAADGAPANITNEVDVGRDFAGFWKNFMTTFNMTGRKVYITGESYAGQYIPYIASYMLDQNDTQYYNVKGIQINDPSIGLDSVLIQGMSCSDLTGNSSDVFPQLLLSHISIITLIYSHLTKHSCRTSTIVQISADISRLWRKPLPSHHPESSPPPTIPPPGAMYGTTSSPLRSMSTLVLIFTI